MDKAIIQREYKFIRDSDDDDEIDPLTRRYEEKLFREFVICDLSRYEESLVGMRWRTEAEVKSGKGSSKCGAKKCQASSSLLTLEVPFSYVEHGERNTALDKAVLCEPCSEKLKRSTKKKKSEKKRRKKDKGKD